MYTIHTQCTTIISFKNEYNHSEYFEKKVYKHIIRCSVKRTQPSQIIRRNIKSNYNLNHSDIHLL